MTTTARMSVDAIDAILHRIEVQKRADATKDPGGHDGPSSHPSAKADGNLQAAVEGSRTSENAKDVKEQIGAGAVDGASVNGTQDSVQPNIGLTQSISGEAPSIETDSAKSGKDDPGSTHPARTDNDALNGGKYASASAVLTLVKRAQDSGTKLLARLAVEADSAAKQAGSPSKQVGSATPVAAKEASASEASASEASASEAAAAGAELADQLIGHDKQAQDLAVLQTINQTVLAAYQLADKTAAAMSRFYQEKRAMDDMQAAGTEAPAETPHGEDVPSGAGGELPPEVEAALLQILTEQQGGNPEQGAAPPAEPAPEQQAPGGDEAMLAEALAQAGVPLEAFEAKVAQKLAKSLKSPNLKPGSWKPKTAAQQQRFQEVLQYVKEITS